MTEIGEEFKSNPHKGKKVRGRVLSRLNMPEGLVTGNVVTDLLWTNSDEVKGPPARDGAFLGVGLYSRDSDQSEAKERDYSGGCDDKTRRKFKETTGDHGHGFDHHHAHGSGHGPDHDHKVKTYLCPDTSITAHNTLSRIFANGILASTINGHPTLYLLADIPRLPKGHDDEDREPGSESPGKIKKLKFHISLIAI